MALYDDQWQSIILQRTGIRLEDKAGSSLSMNGDGGGTLSFAAGLTLAANSTIEGTLTVSKNIIGQASITAAQDVADQGGAKTMTGMRQIFDAHTYSGTDSHGDSLTTSPPSTQQ